MWRTDGCDAVSFALLVVFDFCRWISFLLNILPRLDDVDFAALSDVEKRMFLMFFFSILGKAVEDWGSEEVQDNLYALFVCTTLFCVLFFLLHY